MSSLTPTHAYPTTALLARSTTNVKLTTKQANAKYIECRDIFSRSAQTPQDRLAYINAIKDAYNRGPFAKIKVYEKALSRKETIKLKLEKILTEESETLLQELSTSKPLPLKADEISTLVVDRLFILSRSNQLNDRKEESTQVKKIIDSLRTMMEQMNNQEKLTLYTMLKKAPRDPSETFFPATNRFTRLAILTLAIEFTPSENKADLSQLKDCVNSEVRSFKESPEREDSMYIRRTGPALVLLTTASLKLAEKKATSPHDLNNLKKLIQEEKAEITKQRIHIKKCRPSGAYRS